MIFFPYFPPPAPISSATYHQQTYARRNHACIHPFTYTHWFFPFIPLTRTHFLEVHILGRSFGSFPVFSSNSFFGFRLFLCIFVYTIPFHPLVSVLFLFLATKEGDVRGGVVAGILSPPVNGLFFVQDTLTHYHPLNHNGRR